MDRVFVIGNLKWGFVIGLKGNGFGPVAVQAAQTWEQGHTQRKGRGDSILAEALERDSVVTL